MTDTAKQKKAVNWSISITVVVSILLGWWALRQFELLRLVGVTSNPNLFVPRIEDVLFQFWDTAFGRGYPLGTSLWEHMGWSLYRMGVGVGLAVVVGIPLGMLMGSSSRVAAVFDPIIEFYRPLPPLGYYTLLVVWLGIGEASKVALLFLAALAPIIINTRAGVRGVRESWIEQAQCLGASRSYIFWHVMVPGSLPFIFAGVKLSFGFAYTTLVASELVAAEKGIGRMTLQASDFLRTDIVFMAIITMGLTAMAMDWLLRALENKVIPWRGKV
ncbi:MAG: ABC transporter permease subunit [Chloroflexales bacterium]|nr:ABC transporter permease subunit [Chloroflexales bacterium]